MLQKSTKKPRIPKSNVPGANRMRKTKAGKPRQKSLCAKADKLCREYFQKTAKECEAKGAIVCGFPIPHSERLEWAHLKSRRHKTIRHHPLNYMALSWAAHAFFTCHPDLFTVFVEQKYPGRWERLNDLLKEGSKPDYEYWVSFYSQKLSDLSI